MQDSHSWKLADKLFSSRLLLGSSGYPSLSVMAAALKASETQIVTVAIRRMDLATTSNDFLETLQNGGYTLLPNTAGCYTARDAVLTARLAREALQTNWIKLEVIGDSYTLYPDGEELLKAARELIQDNFIVLPYCSDDPVLCQKLADAGVSAVMPLGAPIGSGQGIRNPYNLELIRNKISLPIIVDAGVGTASHAAQAMELGADAVLMNSAVAKAKDPVAMATAMKHAIIAGRLAFEAGRIPAKNFATPSTPDRGRVTPLPNPLPNPLPQGERGS